MNQWLTLVISSLLALLQRELYTLLPRLSYWLIRQVAGRLPIEIRSRYEEEWLAESEDYVGSLVQVAHATSLIFCGTSGRLTRDYYEGRLLELEESLGTLFVTWSALERQLTIFREQLPVQRRSLLATLKQSANGAVASCHAGEGSARKSGNQVLADKLQDLAKSFCALATTIEQAVSILFRNTDLEIEFLMGVALESKQLVLDASLRVNGTLRLLRRRRNDWDVIEEVVGDVASRVHNFKHVSSTPADSARESRKAHSARIQAAVLKLARPENRPGSLTQQPHT
jgi:hypothetical protein